jgi:hypothetical protein
LALMARKLRSALMAEGEFVDDGLSAFGDDGDITRELTRCLLNGHAVPGLEETFAALHALHLAHDRQSSEREGLLAGMSSPQHVAPATDGRLPDVVRPVVDQALRVHRDDADALARLDALRARKKAADAQRKRVTVARTLAGNPGQLTLFG